MVEKQFLQIVCILHFKRVGEPKKKKVFERHMVSLSEMLPFFSVANPLRSFTSIWTKAFFWNFYGLDQQLALSYFTIFFKETFGKIFVDVFVKVSDVTCLIVIDGVIFQYLRYVLVRKGFFNGYIEFIFPLN